MHSQRSQQFKAIAIGIFLLLSGIVIPSAKAQTSDEELPSFSDQQVLPLEPTPAPDIPLPAQVPPLGTPPTQAVLSAPVVESSYTLGAGDVVGIRIFRVDQYSGESQVLVDGTLNLPLIGKVNVNGLTLEEAADVLSRRYSEYLKRPLITLSLVNRRPLQIGVAGEVSSPGSYTIEQGSTQSARLSQLLATAGGITQAADLTQVQVYRPQLNGNQQTFTVNLLALLEDGNLSQDVTLRDGDSVFVPTAAAPLANSALVADANFARDLSQPINIAIIGEVYRPGPYTLQGGGARTGAAGTPGATGSTNSPTTVTRAIQVAGGIKPQADIRNVQVVRSTRVGTPQVFEADLWQLLNAGDLRQDAVLQEGDTIFVPTATALTAAEVSLASAASFAPDAIRVNVVGEVGNEGVVELPPNTPLSQAILAAGGFNSTRAREGSVQLIRLQDDGTVNRETIDVDFAQGIDAEENPVLRNNDVVIVSRNGLATASDALGAVTRPLGGIFSIFRLFDLFD